MYCNQDIPLPTFVDRTKNIGVGMNEKRLDYFIRTLCDEVGRIPLQTNWAILIIPQSQNLNSQIVAVAKEFDPQPHNIQQTLSDVTGPKYQQVIGCIFAQDIRLPGEDLGVSTTTGYGGHLPGLITETRSAGKTLDVGFLETNRSFSDFFIRPWINLVSYKGLVARSNANSVKSTIILQHFATTGDPGQALGTRKKFVFNDAVPVMLNTEDLTTNQSNNNDLKRQTSFIYSSYSIMDGEY